MARLIPGFVDERTPPGERAVFNLLLQGPSDWIILHSLDLSPWNKQLRTEIDFVVIVPDRGVLCIEVKSHLSISFDGARWSPASITRSPFKQASDGRHSFYRRISELGSRFKTVPVVHCCIFPKSTFILTPNLAVQPWEIMDRAEFEAFNRAEDFCADLKRRIEDSIAADRALSPIDRPLLYGEMELLLSLCVPIQKRRSEKREEIQRREDELERVMRAQQKPLLQLSASNDRVIISGGAGTGKTHVAMELGRRAAAGGRRVALLCFNQLIGDWMKRRLDAVAQPPPNLIAGRAIRVMAEMAGVDIPPSPNSIFWDQELPRLLEERLTDPEFKTAAAFDFLILDEAQDLLARPSLFYCLMQFLVGGVEKGAFALFGDFDHQVLRERELMHETLDMLYRDSKATRWLLSENCRNYRVVGETAVGLAGFEKTVYSAFLRAGGSVENYNIHFYNDENEQLARLADLLREYREQGFRPTEISILSLRADHLSAAARLVATGFRLRPAWQFGDCTAYSTIHSFKGMENKIIILTDLLLEDQGFHRDVFYTGMTRATESVRILCDRRSQATLMSWLAATR